MKVLYLFLLALITTSVSYAQKRQVRFDDWPVTVTSFKDHYKAKKTGEVQPNYVPSGATWGNKFITYFFQNGTGDIAANDERQAVRDAFILWSNVASVHFLEVCSAANADIVISWQTGNHLSDGSPFDGTDGVLAHCFYPPPLGGTFAGDLHFDDAETWTLATRPNNSQPIDLLTVAAHEIGHGIGLDHTTVSGSLMRASYYGSQRFLGSDDIAGAAALYNSVGTNVPISGPSLVCTTGSYSVVSPPTGSTITWSSSDPFILSINSSTGAATRVGNGPVTITATVSSGCGSVQVKKLVHAGTATTVSITTDANGCTGHSDYIVATTSGNPTFLQWNISSGNASNGSLSDYANGTASFYTTVPDCYGFTLSMTNACGSSTAGTSICSSNCLAKYKVYPNPAKDFISVQFDHHDKASAMPEQITLFDENTQKAIYTLENSDIFSKTNSDGLLEINVRSLPRGTYYLHVTTSSNGEKATEKTRILLQ